MSLETFIKQLGDDIAKILKRVERLEVIETVTPGGGGHPPVTLNAGSDPALSLTGPQELNLDLSGMQVALTPGPDIDITVATLQRKGTGVLLFSGGATLLGEYAHTGAGVILAAAAAVSGDVIEIPAGTITGNVTILAGVTMRGLSRESSIIVGQVTLGAGSVLENLTVLNQLNQVGALYGVVSGATGTAKLVNVVVRVENTLGPAYALYMAAGGNVEVIDSELLAPIGTPPYAGYVSAGTLTQKGGSAIVPGSILPYYI